MIIRTRFGRKLASISIIFSFLTCSSALNASCTDRHDRQQATAVASDSAASDNDLKEDRDNTQDANSPDETLDNSVQESATKEKPVVALLGDSMTWISGQKCNLPKGWAYYLDQAGIADTIMLFARSGATWTNCAATPIDTKAYSAVVEDHNVIYNQVIRLIDHCKNNPAPDKILVYAGANDAWFDNKRPGLFEPNKRPLPEDIDSAKPNEFTTMEGSIMLVVEMLRSHFPQAEITFLTPVEAGKIPTAKINAVGDKIEEVGGKLGIRTLRGDRHIPLRHAEEAGKLRKYTTDGAHTNPAGARLIADYLLKEVFTK